MSDNGRKPPPILLRRQNRPAPSRGPKLAPRPDPMHGVAPVAAAPPKPPAAAAHPAARGPAAQPAAAARAAPAAKLTEPKLPSGGAELPIVPLSPGDVPPDAPVCLGTLMQTMHKRTGRPFLMLCVPCDCGRHKHTYPWRGDWPVDTLVRSHQVTRCKKHKATGGVWLALDPGSMDRSLEASKAGKEAFHQWKAWWDKLSPAERSAIAHGRAELITNTENQP